MTVAQAHGSRRVPAEPGLWVVVFGDLGVFGIFFAAYLLARGQSPELFAAAQHELDANLGITYTLLLLTSSLLVARALAGIRVGDTHRAPRLVLAAAACGAAFAVLKGFEYSAKASEGLTPHTNDFFLYYFVLTGLHLVHLLVGLGLLGYLWVLARRPARLDETHLAYAEGSASFWHMVDALWIVIFPLLYLVQ
jgi:nitric oxide reductase NorE protein